MNYIKRDLMNIETILKNNLDSTFTFHLLSKL